MRSGAFGPRFNGRFRLTSEAAVFFDLSLQTRVPESAMAKAEF
jgi:hypothetical protein